MVDDTGTAVPQPTGLVTIRPAPWGFVASLVIVALATALLVWSMSDPRLSQLDNSPIAVMIVVLAGTAVWQWFYRYKITVDDQGVFVSTNYWRFIRRAPIHFARSAGIAAIAYGGAHSSVTINGLHLETTGSHFPLCRKLRLQSINVERRSGSRADTAAVVLTFMASFVFVFAMQNRGVGLLISAAYAALVAVVYAMHTVRVDREWRRVAAANS